MWCNKDKEAELIVTDKDGLKQTIVLDMDSIRFVGAFDKDGRRVDVNCFSCNESE